jgi:DNA-binding SARP family transcriptional activator/TolB-like protein
MTLFGRIGVEDANGLSLLPRSRKTRALLAILALSPNCSIRRSEACDLLWSLRAKDQARASLRQAVHELLLALGAQGTDLFRADRNILALSETCFRVDALAFMQITPPLSELLELFSRPFLEDLWGLDPAFDNWLTRQRERLAQFARTIGENALRGLHDPTSVLHAAEQLLQIDPTHEAASRAMIGAHLGRGDHVAAVAAYDCCRCALAQAGKVGPSPQTDALIDGIGSSPVQADDPLPQWLPRGGHAGAKGIAREVRLGVNCLGKIEPGADNEIAYAVVEEITVAIAQFRWITCIRRPTLSATVDENRRDSVGPAAATLDFVLDGTVQRNASRVRIIMRLSDIRSGGKLVWARRFDRDVTDIFAVQDEIAAEIVAQVDMALLLWEGERVRLAQHTDPDAMELMLGAIPVIYRLEQTGFREAGGLLEASLKLDPANAAAHAWLAYWHLILVGQGWAPDAAAATAKAADLAERAVRLDARDARAMTLAGHVRGFLSKRPHEARALHDRAIALNPNLALAWCFSGLAHSYLGDHVEATRRIRQAQRLAPHDPHGFFFDTAQIMPNLLLRDYESAVIAGRRAVALNPGFSSSLKAQLAALGHGGREDEAADVRERLLVLEPDFCVRDAATRSPMMRREDIDIYTEGLRRAGLPE